MTSFLPPIIVRVQCQLVADHHSWWMAVLVAFFGGGETRDELVVTGSDGEGGGYVDRYHQQS